MKIQIPSRVAPCAGFPSLLSIKGAAKVYETISDFF